MSAFMDRSYRIAADGRSVVCDTVVAVEDNAALADALDWRRRQAGRDDLQDAGAVLELRALMGVDDMLASARDVGPDAVLTLSREQGAILCEVGGAYVSERDIEDYQPPEERDRIARLRTIGGPLMDLCCEFAAAENEARERLLAV